MKNNKFAVIGMVCIILVIAAGCAAVAPAVAQVSASGSAVAVTASASPDTPSPPATPSVAAAAVPTTEATTKPSPSGTASQSTARYKVEVPYDMQTEENTQKSVDQGHSPWKLDPAYVAQVFVSLQILPQGITGDYPIPYEDFKVTQSSDSDAVAEVGGDKTPISKVYLKRLVRQEDGGIWTVVGYDPK